MNDMKSGFLKAGYNVALVPDRGDESLIFNNWLLWTWMMSRKSEGPIGWGDNEWLACLIRVVGRMRQLGVHK